MNGIPEEQLRQQAVVQLKKKSDFRTHVFAYVVINLFLVGIWAALGRHFFWPIFVILGWGIGLILNAWDVYRVRPPSEEEIRREMDRQRRKTATPV